MLLATTNRTFFFLEMNILILTLSLALSLTLALALTLTLVFTLTLGVALAFITYSFQNLNASKFARQTKPPGRKATRIMAESHNASTPVLIITDIGADIDDTLALLALLGSFPAVQIVAVVTCVGNGIDRAALASGWISLSNQNERKHPDIAKH